MFANRPHQAATKARGQPTTTTGTRLQTKSRYVAGPSNPQQLAIASLRRANGASQWTHLTDWPVIREQTIERVLDPSRINIKKVPLCGPTLYMNVLAERRPDYYANRVIEAFFHGTWEGKHLSPRLLDVTPPEEIPAALYADYIALSSLRNVRPSIVGRYKRGGRLAAATTIPNLISWLEDDPLNLEITDYKTFGYMRGNRIFKRGRFDAICDAMREVGNQTGPVVGLLVNSNVFVHGGDIKDMKREIVDADHFIRITSVPQDNAGVISMRIFDHGRERNHTLDKEVFDRSCFGYFIARPQQ